MLQLADHDKRVLVATDCLSEGINLQEHFDAVLHYDLSWNPTRHERGRAGSTGTGSRARTSAPSRTSARQPHRRHRPGRAAAQAPHHPQQPWGVGARPGGLGHGDGGHPGGPGPPLGRTGGPSAGAFDDQVVAPRRKGLHEEWDDATERETRSRTMFAQAGIQVDEVAAESRAAREAAPAPTSPASSAARSPLGGTVTASDGALQLDLTEAHRDLRDRLTATTVRVRTEPPVEDREIPPGAHAPLRRRSPPTSPTRPSMPPRMAWLPAVDSCAPTPCSTSRRCCWCGSGTMSSPHGAASAYSSWLRRAACSRSPACSRAEWLTDDRAVQLLSAAARGEPGPRPGPSHPHPRHRPARRGRRPSWCDGRDPCGRTPSPRTAGCGHGAVRATVTPELPLDVLGVYCFQPVSD
ncbi:MAG: helicase-related protein [Thermoleophilia bacterium]